MKIFVVGDYKTGTGPANVTKDYIEALGQNAICMQHDSKFKRVIEILIRTGKCDVVLCSGYSAQNILAIRWAHLLHKKVAYLMHGSVDYENMINNRVSAKMTEVEKKTMDCADRIYAVSLVFAKWLSDRYPEYAPKIEVQTNGIHTEMFSEICADNRKLNHKVASVGGGMPRKKIKVVCKAIALLRNEKGYEDVTLTVTGAVGDDSEEINAYDFVDNRGLVSHEENMRILNECTLFVQNSSFETFALAPFEALSAGCGVLLSKEVGALSVMGNIGDDHIINDWNDEREIADKIKKCLDCPGVAETIGSMNTEQLSVAFRSRELYERMTRLYEG